MVVNSFKYSLDKKVLRSLGVASSIRWNLTNRFLRSLLMTLSNSSLTSSPLSINTLLILYESMNVYFSHIWQYAVILPRYQQLFYVFSTDYSMHLCYKLIHFHSYIDTNYLPLCTFRSLNQTISTQLSFTCWTFLCNANSHYLLLVNFTLDCIILRCFLWLRITSSLRLLIRILYFRLLDKFGGILIPLTNYTI